MTGRHVFLCYAREDVAAVDLLQAALEAAGVQVWRDTSRLWPGEDWREKIRQAITGDALAFVACFSRNGLARGKSYQNEELALAVEEFRRHRPDVPWLIPVRLDDCEIPDLPIGGGRTLASLERADLFGQQRDRETNRLVTVLTRFLGPHAPVSPGTSAGERASRSDAPTEADGGLKPPVIDLSGAQQNIIAAAPGAMAWGAMGGNAINHEDVGRLTPEVRADSREDEQGGKS